MEQQKASSSVSRGGKTVKECESMIKKSLRTPMVRFLRERLEKAGCPVGDKFFNAVYCDGRAGAYCTGKGVFVCANQIYIQDEVDQVIAHELVHAYDDCRAANIHFEHDCAHCACTEIRANHLSGDCHYKRELLRGLVKIRGHEQECVRRRTMQSVTANPNCPEAVAKDAMEAVWDICYNDTQPFDRAP